MPFDLSGFDFNNQEQLQALRDLFTKIQSQYGSNTFAQGTPPRPALSPPSAQSPYANTLAQKFGMPNTSIPPMPRPMPRPMPAMSPTMPFGMNMAASRTSLPTQPLSRYPSFTPQPVGAPSSFSGFPGRTR